MKRAKTKNNLPLVLCQTILGLLKSLHAFARTQFFSLLFFKITRVAAPGDPHGQTADFRFPPIYGVCLCVFLTICWILPPSPGPQMCWLGFRADPPCRPLLFCCNEAESRLGSGGQKGDKMMSCDLAEIVFSYFTTTLLFTFTLYLCISG